MSWSDAGPEDAQAAAVASAHRSHRYGSTVLVSFGWHLAAFAVAWLNTLVDREDSSCEDASGFCFTAQDGAELLLAASVAFLIVSMVVSLATAALFSRRIRSVLLAGTVSAAAGAGLVVAFAIVLVLAHAG